MKSLFAALSFMLLAACDGGLWNDPYPAADDSKAILYTAFTERPKHLDPAQAYSENEYEFLAHIYSPPLLVMGQYSLTSPLREEFVEPHYLLEGAGI